MSTVKRSTVCIIYMTATRQLRIRLLFVDKSMYYAFPLHEFADYLNDHNCKQQLACFQIPAKCKSCDWWVELLLPLLLQILSAQAKD